MKHTFLFLFLVFSLFSCSSDSSDNTPISEDNPTEEPIAEVAEDDNDTASAFDDGSMRNLTSFEIASEMQIGWNLGNSMDAEGPDETFWGNPVTTQEMINSVSNRGFKTLRIPVTWRFHQGPAPDYIIEEEWLDRVEEIVNYGRANDMYVIINVHHDDEWIIPTAAMTDRVTDRLSKLWTQVANRFRDYSDYLIFETLNEPRFEGTPEEWTGGTEEGRIAVNQYHRASLDAIRATGGNNSLRHLMISTYAASTLPVAMDALEIPNNDPRTMISLHTYFPFPFTLGGTDDTWGSDNDRAELEAEMDRIRTQFIDNGLSLIHI